MKVLYIIPQNKIGGAEVIFTSLNILRKGDIDIIKLDLKLISNNPLRYINAILKVRRIIKVKKVDLILSSLWKSHFVVIFATLFLNVKLVPFIHSTGWFNVFDRMFSKIILYKSSAVIADSFSVCEKTKEYFPLKNILTVSMKINDPICLKEYSNRSNIIKFVFLGRLCNVKRIDKMYKFIDLLKNNLPNYDIFLDLYGPLESDFIPMKKKLEIEYKELNVEFKGELKRQYSQNTLMKYDYYLQLSDIEGMAMSVVEAMSIGLIPIVTSVGEIKYYAKNNFNCVSCNNNDSIIDLVNSFMLIEKNLNEQQFLSKNAIETFSPKPIFQDDIFNVLEQIN